MPTTKHEVEIEIDEVGNTTIHVKGVKGKSCTSVSELFEKVLGTVKSRSCTTEFYEQGQVNRQIVRK